MSYNSTLSDSDLHEVPSALPTTKTTTTKSSNVTFHPTCTVRTPTCRSITDEEKLASYYNKTELRTMKREAVNGLLLHAMSSERSSDTILSNDVVVSTTLDHPLRGLELVLQPQRRKNREVIRQTVLKYQRLLNTKLDLTNEQRHARLAHVTAKLNRWSSHVAFQTAWMDACEAVDVCPMPLPHYYDDATAAEDHYITSPSHHCAMQPFSIGCLGH